MISTGGLNGVLFAQHLILNPASNSFSAIEIVDAIAIDAFPQSFRVNALVRITRGEEPSYGNFYVIGQWSVDHGRTVGPEPPPVYVPLMAGKRLSVGLQSPTLQLDGPGKIRCTVIVDGNKMFEEYLEVEARAAVPVATSAGRIG